MTTLLKITFYISAFIIFWAMIGYPLSLKLFKKIYSNRSLHKDYTYQPSVTVMVVAHNEEKVIEDKLKNIIGLDYPDDKIKFLVANDNSSDNTVNIVREFITDNPDYDIEMYSAKERKGKTNAQNEAQKNVDSEILVMTDANSMLEKDAIKEIVTPFFKADVSYVCGRLAYINEEDNATALLENNYWSLDLEMRRIESNIQTITAGNGAIYACRNTDYYDFDPIKSHDANMPRYFALRGQKALFNEDAIAFEKAGENTEDEFKRKVRMNRGILQGILPTIKILNVFEYKWYSYFYLGHRSSRYLLWAAHLILLISNTFLAVGNIFYLGTLIFQIIFFTIALFKHQNIVNNKLANLIHYYTMTIIAQLNGVYNIISGQAKPTWEKAESTR